MPADSAMLAAVRETVVGLPDKGSTTLSPPPAPRRSTSDQTSSATHNYSSGAPTSRSGGGQARSGGTTSSSSRDPFSDRASRPSRSAAGGTGGSSSSSAKKGSRHADAIDKLDPSNFWGGMLHHESAYDAAAPSRNLKTSSRAAPMGAFDGSSSGAAPPPTTASRRGLSALASRTLDKMGSIKFADDTKESTSPGIGGGGPHSAPAYGAEGAESYFDVLPTVPAGTNGADDRPAASGSSSGGAMSRGLKLIRSRSRDRKNGGSGSGDSLSGAGSERRGSRGQDVPLPDEDDYLNARAKEKKNALANAWGVADPEPFEDFSVMAAATGPRGDTGLASASSSIWNGHERHAHAQPSPPPLPARSSASGVDRKYSLTETYANDEDGEAVEEVLASGDVNSGSYGSMPAATGATVKRSRSLMQRIRNMRDSPNVPIVQDVKPSSPGAGPHSGPLSGSLPTSASYSTFGSYQQQQQQPSSGRRGFFGRQMSGQSDHRDSAPSSGGPSPTSDHSFQGDQQHFRQQQQQEQGRSRSRSDLMSSSVSHGSIATLGPILVPASSSARDKSLPRVPDTHEVERDGSHAGDEDESDPFADAPEPPTGAMPARRPSDRTLHAVPPPPLRQTASIDQRQHRSTPSTASTASTRPIGRTRSPVPPPAPIDLPGQDQSNLYPQRFADSNGNGGGSYGTPPSGNGSGGTTSGLGRKGSLMKRVLGRG